MSNQPDYMEGEMGGRRFSVELLRWLAVLALAIIVLELVAKQVRDLMEVL